MERLLFPIKGLVGRRAVFDGLIRVFIVVTDHPALRSRQGGRTIQGDGLNKEIFLAKFYLVFLLVCYSKISMITGPIALFFTR